MHQQLIHKLLEERYKNNRFKKISDCMFWYMDGDRKHCIIRNGEIILKCKKICVLSRNLIEVVEVVEVDPIPTC